MKKLIIIAILLLAATAWGAGKQYYEFPDATSLKDADRILVFQNNSGSKNLTGAVLKSATTTSKLVHPTTKTPKACIRATDGAFIISNTGCN